MLDLGDCCLLLLRIIKGGKEREERNFTAFVPIWWEIRIRDLAVWRVMKFYFPFPGLENYRIL